MVNQWDAYHLDGFGWWIIPIDWSLGMVYGGLPPVFAMTLVHGRCQGWWALPAWPIATPPAAWKRVRTGAGTAGMWACWKLECKWWMGWKWPAWFGTFMTTKVLALLAALAEMGGGRFVRWNMDFQMLDRAGGTFKHDSRDFGDFCVFFF